MASKLYKEYDRLINKKTGKQYRILAIFDGNIITCQIGTTALAVFYLLETEVDKDIADGVYVVESDDFKVIDPELYFTNPDPEVKQKKIKRFQSYKAVCSAVYSEYKYKLYELTVSGKQKDFVKRLCVEHNISRQTFWKFFTRYLQSGLQDISLIDQRGRTKKTSENRSVSAGKKKRNGEAAYLVTEEDKKKFQKYLRLYLKSEVKTLEEAYLDLVDHEYSVKVKTIDRDGNTVSKDKVLPSNQRPTRRQFFYYIRTHSTVKDRQEAKQTKPVVRNNARVFTGTVMDGVRGPGHYVEMDAQEMDIALISDHYDNIPVGRPIIYVAIDVMSEIILGVSLAMDNNSIVGCTNCMMSLIEDKQTLLKRHNISIEFNDGYTIEDVWPTGVKPRVIKYDNASDFVSIPIARLLEELNIRGEFVTEATGSLKPVVEHFFDTIKKGLDDLLEHKGLIRKTYGSNHHKEACLTFDDAYMIVLNEVLYHNSHILEDYPKSADMTAKGIMASPMELWRYGNQVLVPATTFVSRDDALYHMMLPCKDAKVSRYGIERKGMPYFNASDAELQNRMFELGNKSAKFECRYDPRDMGHLYYLRDGKIQVASLPSDDFRYRSYYGMSEKRFEELEALDKDKDTLVEEYNTQARIDKRRIERNIIETASKAHSGKNKTMDMKQARKEEKEFISGENSVSKRFDLQQTEENVAIPDTSVPENVTTDTPVGIPEETLEQKRLRLMQEAAMMDEDNM